MVFATSRVTQPTKRKGRAAATARPSHKLHCNSTNTDSATVLRAQWLADRGMFGPSATLIADLAWGPLA